MQGGKTSPILIGKMEEDWPSTNLSGSHNYPQAKLPRGAVERVNTACEIQQKQEQAGRCDSLPCPGWHFAEHCVPYISLRRN